MKSPDKRCCGSGVCIISDAGECWCGQVWDGEKMVAPSLNMGVNKPVIPASDNDITTPAVDWKK
jgi:hypothetical protein